MIKVKLKGGLGNQMFQYATGLAVAIHNNTTLALDVSYYKNQPTRDTIRKFELSVFNISQTKTTEITEHFTTTFLKKVKNKIFPNNPYSFDPKVFSSNNLDGAFQNEMYFLEIRDQLLKEFTLKNESSKFKETRDYIKGIKSVAIHIRRGDYVSNPHANSYHGVLGLNYFRKAYDTIVQKIGKEFTLFIFTDDVDWTHEHITFHNQTYMMSTHSFKAEEEMLLMSYCNHNIISNSSFSWWSAWLNENTEKIVIAPKQWTAKNITCDIIPKTWTQI